MTRLILSLVLFTSLSPAALAQSRPVADPPQRVSDLSDQCCTSRFPAVADDRGFVVVWSLEGRVMARRVSPSGQPQNAPVVIQESAFAPTPVSDGQSIMVFSTRQTDRLIQAQVLSKDLRELFAPVIVREGVVLAAVFDGVDYVLVSSQLNAVSGLSEMWLSRVARDGRLVASKKVDLDLAVNIGGGVSIATNGFDYFVAWNDIVPTDCGPFPCIAPTTLRVISFDRALDLTAFRGDVVGQEGYYSSIVWTGTDFVLVWTNLGEVLAMKLEPLKTAAPEVIIDTPDSIFLGTSAVWDGRNVVVVAYRAFSNGELYSVRLDASGTPLDSREGILIASNRGYLTSILLTPRGDGVSLLTYLNGLQVNGYGGVASLIRSEPVRRMRRAVGR